MPTREELLAEAYKRDILPPDMKSAYEEAQKRGLVPGGGESYFTRAKKAITGEERKNPEIKSEFTTRFDQPNAMRTARGMIFSTTPEQMKDVISSNIPGAEFKTDEKGNELVKVPGRDWEYINEPGLSWRDIANLIGQGAIYLGVGKGAAKIAPSSLAMRAGAVGLAEGGVSAGLDIGAQQAGSKQGVNLPRAGATAVVGGFSELLAPLFSALWRGTAVGKMSRNEARKIFVDSGYDASNLSDEIVDNFINIAKTASDPNDAMRLAEAKGLPVPVPLTRGKITMRAQDQMFEDLASKGAYGESAETIMRGAESRTSEALRANVPAIRQQINPAGPVGKGGAGEMAQTGLSRKAAGMKGKVGAAYEAARQAPGMAPGDIVGTMVDDISKSVEDFIPHATVAHKELGRLQEMVTKVSPQGTIVGTSDIDIRKLFDWRRRISTLANNAKDRTEAAALSRMRKQFDQSMSDALKEALQLGDEKSIKAWKKAVGIRRGYGKVFETDDLVSDLIEREGKKLKIDPKSASNYIFGISDTKLLGRPELANQLSKMRSILGPKSPEWNAIREESFLRLAQRGEYGAMTGGEYGFSGVNFKKAVDKMKRDNPEVWNTLFDSRERGLITQFSNVAARATNPVRGGANFSNTAVGISRLVQSIGDALFMGEKGRALLSRILPSAYERVQMAPAAAAAAGRIPTRQIPPGMTGSAGALLESQTGALENY